MSIEETTPSTPSATEAGPPEPAAKPSVQHASPEAEAPMAAAPAAIPEAERPKPASQIAASGTETTTPAEQAGTSEAEAAKSAEQTDAHQDEAPKPAATADAPMAEPPKPLPEALQAIDDQIRAALIMVAHGNARLSKLAGNIRFSYLQRDESQLIAERKKLKAAFQQGESTEAELKPGLQALLQKAEAQAGKLIAPPVKVAAADAAAPAAAPLPAERINQIRRALREAMMSLAAAAPLHLQIELAPSFGEAEPDIMAMAARIHALHRQVLGSLKAIRWTSPTTCTLVFDNDKESKDVEAVFGEQGLSSLPDEYRQHQKPAAGARPAGQGKPQPRHGGAGGKTAHAGGKPGQRPGGGANGAKQARGQQGSDAANAGDGGGSGQKPRHPGARPQGQHQAGTSASGDRHQHGRRPPRGQNPKGEHGAGTTAHKGQGRPHGSRGQSAQAGASGRRADGQDPRGNRGQKSFPSNSAMADKLKAALGGLKLSGTKKD